MAEADIVTTKDFLTFTPLKLHLTLNQRLVCLNDTRPGVAYFYALYTCLVRGSLGLFRVGSSEGLMTFFGTSCLKVFGFEGHWVLGSKGLRVLGSLSLRVAGSL